jgi:hypothetical protein
MNEFQRRVGVGERSRIALRHAGTSKTSPVIREEGRTRGSVAGSTTEHWDGRVDAAATPETVRVVASRSNRQIVDVLG